MFWDYGLGKIYNDAIYHSNILESIAKLSRCVILVRDGLIE